MAPNAANSYQIKLRLVDPRPTIEIDVEAHSPGLALKYAASQNAGYAVESINGVAVLGQCCQCRGYILADEKHRTRTLKPRKGSPPEAKPIVELICSDCV